MYVRKSVCLFTIFLITLFASSQQPSQQEMRKLIDENLQLAAKQYKYLQNLLPVGKVPRSYDSIKNELVTSGTDWWCSGFYPGTLWMIYDATRDTIIKKEAENRLAILEKEKTYTGNHDLGFMMYCSFGNAYSITKKADIICL